MQWNFNPRSREGSDSLASSIASCSVSFQSTLPRRERRQRFVQNCLAVIFQSTLPRRERLIQRCLADPLFIFQSTLPRRERLRRTQPLYVLNAISIHAPAKGATLTTRVMVGPEKFQSTLPRRERRSNLEGIRFYSVYFNPRSREGSDRGRLRTSAPFEIFQSTLPRRERPGTEQGL